MTTTHIRESRDHLNRLIEKTKIVNNCWLYIGARDKNGYGVIRYKEKGAVKAHRLSMHLLYNFDINSSKLILHRDDLCPNKNCWNPLHLYIGDIADNARDRSKKHTSETHCSRGHEYTKENTYRNTRGSKFCKICHLASSRRHYDRKRLSRVTR